jgi:hypothetical protein
MVKKYIQNTLSYIPRNPAIHLLVILTLVLAFSYMQESVDTITNAFKYPPLITTILFFIACYILIMGVLSVIKYFYILSEVLKKCYFLIREYALSHGAPILLITLLFHFLKKKHLIYLIDLMSRYRFYSESILVFFICFFVALSVFLIKNTELSKKVGLFFCAPNSEDPYRFKCEDYLKKKGGEASNIKIICSTGFNTFSSSKSPLHEALKKCGDINVVLPLPFCKQAKNRAKNIGLDDLSYNNHILVSIQYLQEQYNDNPSRNIELKLSTNYPFWRIIKVDNVSFIQQYPTKARISKAPFYAFTHSSYGFHKMIIEPLLNRIWKHKTNYVYNFESGIIENKLANQRFNLNQLFSAQRKYSI